MSSASFIKGSVEHGADTDTVVVDDGERSAGSYLATAGGMAALFALFGYAGGLKHADPFGCFPFVSLLRAMR